MVTVFFFLGLSGSDLSSQAQVSTEQEDNPCPQSTPHRYPDTFHIPKPKSGSITIK
jgi:hypothetical protein